jgi:hypothetical protein
MRLQDERYELRPDHSSTEAAHPAAEEQLPEGHDLAYNEGLPLRHFSDALPVRPARTNLSDPKLLPHPEPEKAPSFEQRRGRSAPAEILPIRSDSFDVGEESSRRARSAGKFCEGVINVKNNEVDALSYDFKTKLKSASEVLEPRTATESTGSPAKRVKINVESVASGSAPANTEPTTSLLGRSRRDSAVARAAAQGKATTPGFASAAPSSRPPFSHDQLSVDNSFAAQSSQNLDPASTGKTQSPIIAKSKRQYKRKRSKPLSSADQASRPYPSRTVRATLSTRRRSGLGKRASEILRRSTDANATEPYQGCSVGYAPPECMRPAGRTRPGQFDEDQLVVGMRFLVI